MSKSGLQFVSPMPQEPDMATYQEQVAHELRSCVRPAPEAQALGS